MCACRLFVCKGLNVWSMRCNAARLVRVVLGADAIENKKLDYGMSLVVLGAEISFKPDCFSCRPAPCTVAKCLKVIKESLTSGLMLAGDAQKLAGRLNWSTQYLVKRLGRAMLRPIYQQKFIRNGVMRPACGCPTLVGACAEFGNC